jgi:hypothetical protein
MKNRVGEKHITNEGYEIEIIEYFSSFNLTIQFKDKTVLKNIQYGYIVRGSIKNPNHRSVYGVGYFGVGVYNGVKHVKIYQTWHDILKRCYSEKKQKRNPSYIGVLVAEEWHNFQVFAKWFEENSIDNFELDKDILCKDCKTYSPQTCCFVPQEINKIFIRSEKTRGNFPIGVHKLENGYVSRININGKRIYLGYFNTPEEAFHAYKTEKEKYIKEVADKWKYQITEQVYNALINYTVEITD